MDLSGYTTSSFTAYGKSFASFGEIAQGRLSGGEDFLVSLPIDLWSECKLVCVPISGNTVVDAPRAKAKLLAELLINQLGLQQGFLIKLRFDSNIPIGKGLSSSTADLLATLRAFEAAFSFELTREKISKLFHQVEPHDPLHYPACVAYNHRKGKLLKSFEYIPEFEIIGIDRGGKVSTEDYNRRVSYSDNEMLEYDLLYESLIDAFSRRDNVAIAQCALESTKLHASKNSNLFLQSLIESVNSWSALGIITTHSGTCAGVILPETVNTDIKQSILNSAKHFGTLFQIKTMPKSSHT